MCSLKKVYSFKKKKGKQNVRLLAKSSKRKHGINKKFHFPNSSVEKVGLVISVWDNIWSGVNDSGMDRDNEQ